MNSWQAIRLVAGRDFKERLASRAFQLSTGITVLFVVAAIVVPAILIDDEPEEWKLGVVGPTPNGLATAVEVAVGGNIVVDTVPFESRQEAELAIQDGEVELAVDAAGKILVDSGTEPRQETAVMAALAGINLTERADELGIEITEVADLVTGGYEIESVTPEADEDDEENRIFAFFVTVILFMSIVTYGSWILIGVIEEKTNRVVEVVLGTLRPHQLLAGKVLGIGLLGVAQILLLGVIAAVLLPIQDAFRVPSAAGAVLVYAVAYAAAGSLVSRQEEAQNAAFPLTMMLMAAYFIASFSITGENTVLMVASLLPMFAPMTMPLRIAGGDASVWQLAVSLSLMVVSTYGLVRLAGRVYAGGLLQGAGRVKWKEAFRASDV